MLKAVGKVLLSKTATEEGELKVADPELLRRPGDGGEGRRGRGEGLRMPQGMDRKLQ
jgi:hypothetical protein